MQVLIAISGFCPRIGNVPCTTPFDFLFVISIHVPTWGTTLSISTNLFALIFQSTFPRGERHHQPGYHYLLHSFQSTFPRRERRLELQWSHMWSGFQSTFLRRERHEMRKKIKVISRFQSTFPRGERRWQYTVTRGVSDFNPRSLVGNDYGISVTTGT